MGWIEQLPSGRHRGIVRLANGSKRSRSFDYAYEAEAWMLEAEERTDAAAGEEPALPGPRVPPHVSSVHGHGVNWLERKRGGWTKATYDFYELPLRVIGAHDIGRLRLDQIRKVDVEEWVTEQVDASVGAATITARLKVLGMICRDARANGFTGGVDATDGIRKPTADLKPDRVLTTDEQTVLIATATRDADELAQVLLMLDAGLRWQEMAGLSVHGVDLRRGFVTVFQVVERSGRLRAYPKGHRLRVVPLTERTIAALLPVLRRARLHRGPHGLLWTTQTGRVLDYHNHDRDLWTPLVRASKIRPRPGCHSLRHTYGTRLADAGVPRHEIAVLMGHADEKTTQRYIHAGDDGRRQSLVRAALAS